MSKGTAVTGADQGFAVRGVGIGIECRRREDRGAEGAEG